MSASARRRQREEPERRARGAARRLGGAFRFTADGGVPHAVFDISPTRQLVAVWSNRRFRCWVRPLGELDRSLQTYMGEATSEQGLDDLLAECRQGFVVGL